MKTPEEFIPDGTEQNHKEYWMGRLCYLPDKMANDIAEEIIESRQQYSKEVAIDFHLDQTQSDAYLGKKEAYKRIEKLFNNYLIRK